MELKKVSGSIGSVSLDHRGAADAGGWFCCESDIHSSLRRDKLNLLELNGFSACRSQ